MIIFKTEIPDFLLVKLKRLFSFVLLIIWIISPVLQRSGFAQTKSLIDTLLNSGRSFNNDLLLSKLISIDDNAPTVHFVSLHHYTRVSGQIGVQVEANDDVGISRIEFYVDGQLLGTQNIVPHAVNTSASFTWNTAAIRNGKHIAQAKAFDTTGNNQTATVIVLSRNLSTSLPAPTATFTATPATIINGQSSTLSWTTNNAASVTINQGIGSVAVNGSINVSPTATTTYTLTVINETGSIAKTAAVTVAPLSGNNIAVNPLIRYQTMQGWEATDQAAQLFSPAWNNYKNSLLDQAVNDLGINRIRLEIFSGIENPTDYFTQWRSGLISESQYNAKRHEIINDNSDPNSTNPNGFKWSQVDSAIENIILPMRQRLQARGESLWVNVNYVDFGSSTFEHKNNPSEYAEFVLTTYQHMQSRYGFVPNSWEVILEPDSNGAAWSKVQVAQAIKAAGDLLAAHNFTPNFIAPSTTNAWNAPAYIDQIATTPGAMQYVGEFSYHRYVGVDDTILTNIANRALQYNKQVGMLEKIGADYVALHQDLKSGLNSSWQQYTLAFVNQPDNGAQYYRIDDSNINNPIITLGSRTKFLRQYFKFIRSGAQRIEALSANTNFDPLAFINTNGKYVVVVKTSAGGSFNILGLPAGTYGVKYTTASEYDVNLPDKTITAGQTLTSSVPSSGVITIYAR